MLRDINKTGWGYYKRSLYDKIFEELDQWLRSLFFSQNTIDTDNDDDLEALGEFVRDYMDLIMEEETLLTLNEWKEIIISKINQIEE